LHLDGFTNGNIPQGVMEAMATGLPLVALAQPGLTEFIEDGVNGWLLPADSTSALAERLTILADEPALRSRAGHASLQRVLSEFSIERTAAQMAALFRKSISARFSPSVSARAAGVLCLLESWPVRSDDPILPAEMHFLASQPVVAVFAAAVAEEARPAPLPAGMEFLPDAEVVESVWCQEQALTSRVLEFRRLCPATPGEEFFRAARRAVYLAALRRTHGWHHVHALRSSTALWAWLLHQLTGITASAVIESNHGRPVAVFREILGGFAFGSVSDPALAGSLPNLLPAGPPATPRWLSGLFRRHGRAADPSAVWQRWLAQAGQSEPPVDPVLPNA
jgi:hypothetical protein